MKVFAAIKYIRNKRLNCKLVIAQPHKDELFHRIKQKTLQINFRLFDNH